MEESKIVVRYGCDSCGTYFKNMDDLHVVDVMTLRQDPDRTGIKFEPDRRLVCDPCLKEREVD